MPIDRNRVLCALAVAAGLLPFSGCSNADKPAADPGVVNVVVDHPGDHDSKPTKTVPFQMIDDPKATNDAAKPGATGVNK